MKVSLDSRQVKKGEYFVPVKGENFDGHRFIDQALNNGAKGVLEEPELYEIASNKLNKINPITVGVAGSVGKSTFRAFLTQILSYKYKTLEGTLNTKLGLAVNVVNGMKSDDKVFVAEMGIDRLGEMQQTAKFIKPNFSVITKIEKEHLQFLLNLKNVIKENLFAIALSKEKAGYINKQDLNLVEPYTKDLNITFFSKEFTNIIYKFDKALYSDHELDYLSCVYKIVRERFGFSDTDFISAVKNIKRPKGRLNLIKGKNNSLILDDSYNAVCDSSVIRGVDYALKYAQNHNLKLTIILSPLRETGSSSNAQHKKVAEYLNSASFKKLYLIGDGGSFYSSFLTKPFKNLYSSEDLTIIPNSSDLFYVKGSQFYRTEKCVKTLMQNPNNAKDLLVRQDSRWV